MKSIFSFQSRLGTALLFLTISIPNISAQDDPLSSNFKKGRFYNTEGYEFKFKSLKSDGDYFMYTNSKNQISKIKKEEILRIDLNNGSKALQWAGFTGLVTLASAWVNIELATQTNNVKISNQQKFNFVAIITAVGAITGGLIGRSLKNYTRIYESNRIVNQDKKLQFKTSMLHNKPALGITFRF